MLKFTLVPFVFLIVLISGCGGDGSGTSSSGSPVPNATPKVLASVQSGGATEFTLDNGKIVFSDYNRGELQLVSSDGGEIKTLYANSWASPGKVAAANGKVFILNTHTAGGIFSIPEDATGISTLVDISFGSAWPLDISCDGTFVYWSFGSNVYRAPLMVTTKITETIYMGGVGGTARMALNGNHLYITDSASRKLFLVNTTTLETSELLSFSEAPSWEKFYFGIPLAIDMGHINALVDNRNIHRIGKANLQDSIAATNYMSINDVKIVADTTGVYWWEQLDANNLSLKKIDSVSGSTTTLLTMPFTWYLDAFISDGSNIYWFEHEYDPVGDLIYKIKRVSINGGNADLVATYTSDINIGGALLPRVVTFNADNLYWTSSTTNIVVKLNKSGGQPEIVTWFDTYSAITAINGFVLAANNSSVTKIPINGVTPATLEWSLPNTSSSIPTQMTKDDSNLYWTVHNGTVNEGYETDVYSKPLSGGTAIKLASVSAQNTVNKLYPYDDTLFLAERTYNGGLIRAIPKTGGDERILVNIIGFEPNDLQIVGSTMYLLADGVHSINLNTGETKTLVKQAETKSIYVDGMYIYWTQANYGGGGGLYRLPVAGGTMQTVYNGSSWKVTGDNTKIYWATGSRILSVEK